MSSERDCMTEQFAIPTVMDAVATAIPDRLYFVQGGTRMTYRQITVRARRFATFLADQGLGCHTERPALAAHQVGQDLLGIYAMNGHEYIEGLLGASHARVAPFNINFRYVKDELRYLVKDAGASALLYQAAFAPQVAEILPDIPQLRVLIQIDDSSGHALLPGAVDFESIISADRGPRHIEPPSPDDLYVLYTGGTTGRPKGVLWRQHDIFVTALGGRDFVTSQVLSSCAQVAERAAAAPPTTMLILPPLMHGAAQWAALTAMTLGQTIVMPTVVDRLDADEIVTLIAEERIQIVQAVGDAMARPILEAAASRPDALSSLMVWANGGAALTSAVKNQLLAVRPGLVIIDGVGSSETGQQLRQIADPTATANTFSRSPGTCIVSEDFQSVLEPGHDGIGWLAQAGSVPLGYLGDADKTRRTFPQLNGTRFSIPGDRARHLADGTVELLGRDATTINSGGEKIFAEEVENAIASHPSVSDVMVVGRPSERWGHEVTAVVSLSASATTSASELIDHAAQFISRYKLPKAIIFRAALVRSPAGKPDYRWAMAQTVADTAQQAT